MGLIPLTPDRGPQKGSCPSRQTARSVIGRFRHSFLDVQSKLIPPMHTLSGTSHSWRRCKESNPALRFWRPLAHLGLTYGLRRLQPPEVLQHSPSYKGCRTNHEGMAAGRIELPLSAWKAEAQPLRHADRTYSGRGSPVESISQLPCTGNTPSRTYEQ